MGFGMPYLHYLSSKGYLRDGSVNILDIGSQNLYHAQPEDILAFLAKYGAPEPAMEAEEFAKRLSYFSYPRPGERTSYLSELLERTRIHYTSYDVCPGHITEIFDLNFENAPAHYLEKFDIILNFGTTEHVISQYNSFKVMHDALSVGGIMLHQLPSTGWINHGYFCYHPLFFADFAKANDYEIVDQWYSIAGQANIADAGLDFRAPETPEIAASDRETAGRTAFYSFNLNIVMRKTRSQPFRVSLELETSHAAPAAEISAKYGLHGPEPAPILSEENATPARTTATKPEADPTPMQRHEAVPAPAMPTKSRPEPGSHHSLLSRAIKRVAERLSR